MNIQNNISLQSLNTFRIKAKAKHFVALNNSKDLSSILTDETWAPTTKLILGGGSNILLTQDYQGLVIHNELKGVEIIDENNKHIWLKIAAGENWHQFVIYCVTHGYGGIENLSLIPGTVGAAPMQNIGAYGVEICSVFESLAAMEIATAKIKTFTKQACQFGYRNSIFKNSHKDRYIIINVTLKLNKKPQLNTNYGAIQATLEAMGEKPSIQSISKAVIRIRQSKLPDPNKIPNAGSFFKNPFITKETFNTLQNQYPEIPHYPAPDNQIKVPAAWLIEQCGWKGKTLGNASVHQHQALVIVNRHNASGTDLKKLADAIQQSVNDQFGIVLTPEVNII